MSLLTTQRYFSNTVISDALPAAGTLIALSSGYNSETDPRNLVDAVDYLRLWVTSSTLMHCDAAHHTANTDVVDEREGLKKEIEGKLEYFFH